MTKIGDFLPPPRIPIRTKKPKGKLPDEADRLISIRETIQMIHWALDDYHASFHGTPALTPKLETEQAVADLVDEEAAKIDATARHLGIVK